MVTITHAYANKVVEVGVKQCCAPALLKFDVGGVFVGTYICKQNCHGSTCCCVIVSMCPAPQTMEEMPVVWQSLAPDERRGRRRGGSRHWSSSRKPRWGRRSNMRLDTSVLCMYSVWQRDPLVCSMNQMSCTHELFRLLFLFLNWIIFDHKGLSSVW